MNIDKINYDDERYSEQAMQSIQINRKSKIYPKSLQNFDSNMATAKRKKAETANTLLDDDISDWLNQQDLTTKRHINEIIRHAMQMKMAIS